MSREGFLDWLAKQGYGTKPLTWTPPDRAAIAEMVRAEFNVSGRCIDAACRIQMTHPRHVVRP